jgi:hypothetical protein
MNSIAARNAALLLILSLLLYVFNGIYSQQIQHSQQQPSFESTMGHKPLPHSTQTSSTVTATGVISHHANAEEVGQVMRTGRLPATTAGKEGRKLSVDELEEVASTGQLPRN